MKAPEQLLVIAIDAIFQRWKEGLPQVIRDKPLPDPDDLNAAIPVAEWEIGIDGQKRPPWASTSVVYFIDPATGSFYTFVSSTTGGRIAVELLDESVSGMRMLRGGRVLPIITLGRAADEDEIRRQNPSAFRDRRLEGGWRSRSRERRQGGLAAGVQVRSRAEPDCGARASV